MFSLIKKYYSNIRKISNCISIIIEMLKYVFGPHFHK